MTYLGFAAKLNATDFAEQARKTAARAALVVADDLPACITLMRRTEGDLAGLKGAALARGMDLINDLMRFWVSDAAFARAAPSGNLARLKTADRLLKLFLSLAEKPLTLWLVHVYSPA